MIGGHRMTTVWLCCLLALPLGAAEALFDSLFHQQRFDELRLRLTQATSGAASDPAVTFYRTILEPQADSAAALYRQVIAEAPNSHYAEQGLYRLGQYHYFRKEFRKARNFFSAVFKKFPQSSLRDDAQYLYCRCIIGQGKIDSARVFLNAFVQNVRSPFVDQAILDLEQLGGLQPEDYFTIRVAEFSDRERAQEAAQKLMRVFSHVEVVEVDQTHWAVAVGKFPDRDKAQRYAELYIQPSSPHFSVIARRP